MESAWLPTLSAAAQLRLVASGSETRSQYQREREEPRAMKEIRFRVNC
jgi:hypothetical protein